MHNFIFLSKKLGSENNTEGPGWHYFHSPGLTPLGSENNVTQALPCYFHSPTPRGVTLQGVKITPAIMLRLLWPFWPMSVLMSACSDTCLFWYGQHHVIICLHYVFALGTHTAVLCSLFLPQRAFSGLLNLKWLHLDGNEFSSLDPTVLSPLGKTLHGLELHGNPWNCTCMILPLRQWMSDRYF